MAALHALLLTDIVDSTRLTEQLDEGAATALWSAHDRLARDLIPRWRGREIDKTDGMLLLFDSVPDALGYALAYHRRHPRARLGIKARAGIHFGAVTLRANPADDVARGAKPIEVDGIALPMVARVMSIAGGGQTLLSEDARRALGVLPLRVQSHGHWLLHGIAQPIELFEVADDDVAVRRPADGSKAYRVVRQGDLWQPLREDAALLPAERDSFVGRQESLESLAEEARGRCPARVGARHGRHRQDAPGHALRLDAARRLPGGCLVLRPVAGARARRHLFAVAQGLEVPLGQADPVCSSGRRSPAAAIAWSFSTTSSRSPVRRGDVGALARARASGAFHRDDARGARHRRRRDPRRAPARCAKTPSSCS